MDLQIRVRKQVLTCRQTAVSNSVNFIKASFMFDEEWAGTEKHVIFSNGDIPSKEVVLDNSMTCIVPWEVLEQEGSLYISVVGILEDKRITTKLMENPIEIYASGELGGSAPQQPSPSPWDYYDGQLEEIRADISKTLMEYTGVAPEISKPTEQSLHAAYLMVDVSLADLQVNSEDNTINITPNRSNIPPMSAYIDGYGEARPVLEADMLSENFVLDLSKINPEESGELVIPTEDFQQAVIDSGGTFTREVDFAREFTSQAILRYKYMCEFNDSETRDAFYDEFLTLVKAGFVKFQSLYKKKDNIILVTSEAL